MISKERSIQCDWSGLESTKRRKESVHKSYNYNSLFQCGKLLYIEILNLFLTSLHLLSLICLYISGRALSKVFEHRNFVACYRRETNHICESECSAARVCYILLICSTFRNFSICISTVFQFTLFFSQTSGRLMACPADIRDWAAMSENVPLNMCAQRWFRSACAFAQSDQTLHSAQFW